MPYALNDGVKLYWEDQGAGDPVLLIMGLGYPLGMWHRVRPVLAEAYRVILFDNRGVGRSDVPLPPYTIRQMADDAAAVLDAAGVPAAHVVGASLGGMVAQELTLRRPDRVRSLILACTTCGGAGAALPEPEVLALLTTRVGVGLEEGFRASVPFIYYPDTPAERIEADLRVRLRTVASEQGYLGQLQAAATHTSDDRLGQIRVPTLVVHGRSDRLVPPRNGELLASRIPGARLVLLANAGHILFTDQPEAAREAVLGFLAEVSGRGGVDHGRHAG